MFYKILVHKNLAKFTGKHKYRSLFFKKFGSWKPATSFSTEFSCEFGKIFRDSFLREHLRTTASDGERSAMKQLFINHLRTTTCVITIVHRGVKTPLPILKITPIWVTFPFLKIPDHHPLTFKAKFSSDLKFYS